MKKIFLYALVVLACTYGIGYYSFGESGVNRFLDKSQTLTLQGDAQGLCDQLADDVQVAIIDHTAKIDPRLGDGRFNGGKAEFCEKLQVSVPALANGGISLQIHRSGLQITRQQWLHPWTAIVTYNEKQEATIQAGGRSMTIKTESDDKMQLGLSLQGVKIKSLESEAWLQ